jgi:hypothetical protein
LHPNGTTWRWRGCLQLLLQLIILLAGLLLVEFPFVLVLPQNVLEDLLETEAQAKGWRGGSLESSVGGFGDEELRCHRHH